MAPSPPGRSSALRATLSHLAARPRVRRRARSNPNPNPKPNPNPDPNQEGTVRVKNEILVQMDGVSNADANERLLLVGATNRPQELD